MAWKMGKFYIAGGQSVRYWISWGGSYMGTQFIQAVPESHADLMTTSVSIQLQLVSGGYAPRYLWTYWCTITNLSSLGAWFRLEGRRCDI